MSDGETTPVPRGAERQLTFAPHGHILTNTGVFSPDGRWIVYDVRSDVAGDVFDGERIEMVNVDTGEVRLLYQSRNGAHCGVATWDTQRDRVVFILGPENPTLDFAYAACRRQGVIVDIGNPNHAINLDARALVSPFTPGALRGGTHVHVFSPDGNLVSFTYQDHILSQFTEETPQHDVDLRNLGVSALGKPVKPTHEHERNHDGIAFSVLVTRTTANPRPGSDDISRAFEEGWVRTPVRPVPSSAEAGNGDSASEGTGGTWSLAFQGHVLTQDGSTISEVFIVDLPDDLTQSDDGPLQGTETRRPFPPEGCVQRRLTCTAGRKYPGIQGPRHWLRSSPADSRIAFLMKDDDGIVQLWTIAPAGGRPRQLTHNFRPIASAFSWSPDGNYIAHIMDNSVCLTDAKSGQTHRLTQPGRGAGALAGTGSGVPTGASAPLPEACVFSPDGRHIAFVRQVDGWNQLFVLSL
ncbi:MAG: DUF3748 domain-containing protein [Tepidisphaeraceae bacterium]